MKLGLDDILQHSFRAEYVQADVSPRPVGHSTGWRTLPFFMFSQAGSGAEVLWLERGRRWKAAPDELILLPAGIGFNACGPFAQWVIVGFGYGLYRVWRMRRRGQT